MFRKEPGRENIVMKWNALATPALVRKWGRGLLVAGAASLFPWQHVSILYAGRHWFTDVLGAWLLSGTSIAIMLVVWQWWQARRRTGSTRDDPYRPAS